MNKAVIIEKKKPDSYATFYGLLNRMYAPDKEELKKSIVSQYTSGRTDSLSAMTVPEYAAAIKGMRTAAGQVDPNERLIRRKRSVALREVQLYGVDTVSLIAVAKIMGTPVIVVGVSVAAIAIPALVAITVPLLIKIEPPPLPISAPQ